MINRSLLTIFFSIFLVSSGFSRDLEKELDLANDGNISSQLRLAHAYRFGKSIEQDYEKSLSWYLKAASKGQYIAQGDLGYMYSVGEGVDKNLIEAYAWMSASIKNGPENWKKSMLTKKEKVSKVLSEQELEAAELLAIEYSNY